MEGLTSTFHNHFIINLLVQAATGTVRSTRDCSVHSTGDCMHKISSKTQDYIFLPGRLVATDMKNLI